MLKSSDSIPHFFPPHKFAGSMGSYAIFFISAIVTNVREGYNKKV